MTRESFDVLLNLVQPSLIKDKHRISAEERLSITLLVLAHATSFQSVAWSHKLGKTTVRNIVLETCEALWNTLSSEYLAEPTERQYEEIENDLSMLWNMPNCVGAIDGKHVAVKCPRNSGSLFYNYKKYYSIVLISACDANYCFTSVSVASYGNESDGGIFRLSKFGMALLEGRLPLPPPKPLPSSSTLCPHYFVADAAFPLKENIIRPYPGQKLQLGRKVFNYRLSRARRTIENSFGILAARWRILLTTIDHMPENCESIVLACLVLHNFLMKRDADKQYCPQNYVDREVTNEVWTPGGWRIDVQTSGGPLRSISSHHRRSCARSIGIRDCLKEHFTGWGAVPFQPSE